MVQLALLSPGSEVRNKHSSVEKHYFTLFYLLLTVNMGGGGAVALLVDTLRYKLEDRGFDS